MLLRKVSRLDIGMRIVKPLRDDDIPPIVVVKEVRKDYGDRFIVEFWTSEKKSEGVSLYHDDLVEISI